MVNFFGFGYLKYLASCPCKKVNLAHLAVSRHRFGSCDNMKPQSLYLLAKIAKSTLFSTTLEIKLRNLYNYVYSHDYIL